jgi:acyl-CoA synthetase (AMP-forming)/AMP-acid ligase II
MNQSLLAKLNSVLPHCLFIQKYGTSEFGSPRSRSRASNELWININSSECEVKIVDNVLWLRSSSTMLGYLNAPSPFDENGWLCTGDEVIVDGDWIQILGRKSEVINVGGEKVYPAEVESVLHLMEGVEEVVVSGETNLFTGQIVKATVKLTTNEALEEFRKRMQLFCEARMPNFKIPQKVLLAAKELHGERFKKIRNTNG